MLAEEASIGALLKFVGTGASGPIMTALGERSLRTKKLTERVPTYAPRSIYRQAHKLLELDLLARQETEGVPSSVLNSLSIPRGRELYRLIDTHATAVLPLNSVLPAHDGSWTSFGLLGQMWAAGWINALSHRGQSATNLAESTASLTFHQVSRRTQQLTAWNLLYGSVTRGHHKRFQMTDQARQGMGLIAGVARWRQRHVPGVGEVLTATEMTTVLRTCMPLLEMPNDAGKSVTFGIVGAIGETGAGGSETLTGSVGIGGMMRSVKERGKSDSWALGTVDTWLAAILDQDQVSMRIGGDSEFTDRCLKTLYEALWLPRVLAVAI